jgi:hypothetical protein
MNQDRIHSPYANSDYLLTPAQLMYLYQNQQQQQQQLQLQLQLQQQQHQSQRYTKRNISSVNDYIPNTSLSRQQIGATTSNVIANNNNILLSDVGQQDINQLLRSNVAVGSNTANIDRSDTNLAMMSNGILDIPQQRTAAYPRYQQHQQLHNHQQQLHHQLNLPYDGQEHQDSTIQLIEEILKRRSALPHTDTDSTLPLTSIEMALCANASLNDYLTSLNDCSTSSSARSSQRPLKRARFEEQRYSHQESAVGTTLENQVSQHLYLNRTQYQQEPEWKRWKHTHQNQQQGMGISELSYVTAIARVLKILEDTVSNEDQKLIQEWVNVLSSTDRSSYTTVDDNGQVIKKESPIIDLASLSSLQMNNFATSNNSVLSLLTTVPSSKSTTNNHDTSEYPFLTVPSSNKPTTNNHVTSENPYLSTKGLEALLQPETISEEEVAAALASSDDALLQLLQLAVANNNQPR